MYSCVYVEFSAHGIKLTQTQNCLFDPYSALFITFNTMIIKNILCKYNVIYIAAPTVSLDTPKTGQYLKSITLHFNIFKQIALLYIINNVFEQCTFDKWCATSLIWFKLNNGADFIERLCDSDCPVIGDPMDGGQVELSRILPLARSYGHYRYDCVWQLKVPTGVTGLNVYLRLEYLQLLDDGKRTAL